MQVWLALLASVIFTTVAYHMLNYSSPFGEFDTMRLRRSSQAPNEVKTYIVQSRAPRGLLRSARRARVGSAVAVHIKAAPSMRALGLLQPTGQLPSPPPQCWLAHGRLLAPPPGNLPADAEGHARSPPTCPRACCRARRH